MDRNISPVNTKGQDGGYPENEEEEMKKRIVIAMVTGLIIASLTGCGTQADATDQEVPESSAIESGAETDETATDEITSEQVIEDNTGDPSESVGAENDSIVLFAEIAEYGDYEGQKDKEFEPVNDTLVATEDVPVFNGDGIEVGYVKSGSTIIITESGLNAWARFENPIDGTDYDYLYVMKDYIIPEDELHLDAVSMAQKIQDYINTYGFADIDIDYTFATEKTSDMEVYEFRMDSVYDDETMLDYWLNQNLSLEKTDVFYYETLYVECEEDTDGWIICRIYYKDKVELEY